MYHELLLSNFVTMTYMLHTQVHVSPLSPLLSVYQSSFCASNFLLELMQAVYKVQIILDELYM